MPDNSDFSYLSEMMRKHGVTCTPEEFHAAVNIAFHKYESEHYDEGHRDMWDSLPTQFSLLTGDCLRQIGLPARMNALDIGCGTGLASDCLLRTELGKRIASINLLDTSAAMLSRAKQRAESWNIRFTSTEGILEDLPGAKQYDFIVTCSVLHHIPDLKAFLTGVRNVQAPNGFFMHLQDPNGDFLHDPELAQR